MASYSDTTEEFGVNGNITCSGDLEVSGSVRTTNITSNQNPGGIIYMWDPVYLADTTSNWIRFNNVGLAPPSLISLGRSIGTKITLYPDVSDMDYALGVDTNSMWLTAAGVSSSFDFSNGNGKLFSVGSNGITLKNTTAASTAASGYLNIYSESSVLKSKNSTGTVTIFQPVTTKGDLVTCDSTTLGVRLPVGANGKVLSSNSATSTGLEWVSGAVPPPVRDSVVSNYSLSTTVITTSYTDIPFENYRNTNGNTGLVNNTEFTFNETGTYFIFCTVTLSKTVGTTPTTCTLKMVEDASGTGSGSFSDVAGLVSYTYNPNVTTTADTGYLCYVKTYNKNDRIKTQGIKFFGTGDTIVQLSSGSNLNVVNFKVDGNLDTTSYFNGYKTVSVALTGSFANVSLDTSRITNSDYTFTPGNAEVTVNTSGTYLVFFTVNIQKTTGVDASAATFRLVKNASTNITGTDSTAFVLNGDNDLGSTCGNTVIALTTGDTIKIQGATILGTNLFAAGTSLILVKLQSSSNAQSSTKYADLTSANTLLGTVATNIPFATENILTAGTFTHSVSVNTQELTINEPGYYYLFGMLTMTNTAAGNSCARVLFQYNSNGLGFQNYEGSFSDGYVHVSGRKTVCNSLFVYIPANTIIKLQGLRTSTTGVLTTDGANCSLTAVKASTSDPLYEPVSPFGTYTKVSRSLFTSTTATTPFVMKTLLVTGLVPNGYYRVDYTYKNVTAAGARGLKTQILLNTATVLMTQVCQLASLNDIPVTSGFVVFPLKSGSYNIQLDFGARTAASVSISDVTLMFYRVS
jgi:hypothetical protein